MTLQTKYNLNKTLFISDLDGTLLNKSDKLSLFSLNVINSLIEKGIHFTYATARSLSSDSIVTQGLFNKLPVIVYNGAFIIDKVNGEKLAANFFNSQNKNIIIDILKKNQLSPLVYSYINDVEKVSWLPNNENMGLQRYINNRKGDKRLNSVNSGPQLYEGKIFYFVCIGKQEDLLPVYEAIKVNTEFNCTLQQELYRKEYWLEIMPKNTTKANALIKLKKLLNVNKIISFGDAVNDIPMFSVSDESYAVSNAVPELKKISTDIIKSNEEHGVADWLNKVTLI